MLGALPTSLPPTAPSLRAQGLLCASACVNMLRSPLHGIPAPPVLSLASQGCPPPSVPSWGGTGVRDQKDAGWVPACPAPPGSTPVTWLWTLWVLHSCWAISSHRVKDWPDFLLNRKDKCFCFLLPFTALHSDSKATTYLELPPGI